MIPESEKKRPSPVLAGIGFCLIAVIAVIDYITGYQLGFSIFYLVPIILVAWSSSLPIALLAAVVSYAAWMLADLLARVTYPMVFVYYWNSSIRLVFFVTVAYLMRRLKSSMDREKDLARHDRLTGLPNTLSFTEAVNFEIERSRRYKRPFTVAYIDVDGFKAINDRFGHSKGDAALRCIADAIRESIRALDTPARLHGDEFVLLLPETDDRASEQVLERLKENLNGRIEKEGLPVSFSIGAATFVAPPKDIDEILERVDGLMYSAKKSGGDGIERETVLDET